MTIDISINHASPDRRRLELEDPGDTDNSDLHALVRALRFPGEVFGDAAAMAPEARCEDGIWDAVPHDLEDVLADFELTADHPLKVLRATAEFLHLHQLRLCGHPWLCVLRYEDVSTISYVLHLDLCREDANDWHERYLHMLASRDLRHEAFSISLRKRGPRRP